MQTINHKLGKAAFSCSLALAVSAGTGVAALTVDLALTPGVAAAAIAPEHLKDALLAVGDLPKGYASMPDALKAFSDVDVTAGTRAGVCKTATGAAVPERPVAPGEPTGPGLPVHPNPRMAIADRSGPGEDKGGSGSVRAAFMKGDPGPILLEVINPAGDRSAAIVDAVAEAPRRCPIYEEGKPGSSGALHMATLPLDVPKFGDKSAGVRFEVELTNPRATVHGKMVAVSVGGVAVTVLLANLEDPDQKELVAIAEAAVQKIKSKE
ncbi:hypothetical protein [Actinoplanes regularis]|uniref:PknH-like extracellular domain-containing protein n=1 Tax=Actinoplanes regularis TaxID=52697 RepID=A0A238W6V1_9ACTN|nr:hypothetical protein [Actinoplanes regularis]GIE85212.1 hypothetical protein Are01nite_16920 [Actinoplanes regularis]SNR42228.1 hypothetical protein SAMN06264365_102215 [Actinoplanes regularis]